MDKISANIRTHVHKGDNHKLMRAEKVPGVLYGMKNPNLLVEFSNMDLDQLFKNSGEHGVISVELGNVNELVIIKEVQREPLTGRIRHIDLQRINMLNPIKTKVPIVLKGEEYFRDSGTILQQQLSEVEIECTPANIPRIIYADVSILNQKRNLTLGDLEISSEISILNNINTTVVTVNNLKAPVVEVVEQQLV